MASLTFHRRKSKEFPPSMASDYIRLREEFISLYDRDYAELKWSIKKLHGIMNKFEEDFRSTTEISRLGAMAGIAGGATVIAGIALAPFTLGASTGLTVAGLAMCTGGAVNGGMFQMKKILQLRKQKKIMEEELKKFESTITPLIDVLQKLNQWSKNVLRSFDLSENDYNVLSELYLVSGSELIPVARIKDIGEVAAQVSKTRHLITALLLIFTGIALGLNILSFLEDDKALDDMNKLARTRGQIDEREMKSKAGEFITKMRKVITDLEKTLEEISKTKNNM